MIEDARLYLSARRPSGQDDADPPIAAALQRTREDVALAAWAADQTRIDRCLAKKLCAVQPPSGLRERILAGGKVSSPGWAGWFERRSWRTFRNSELLAVAAVVLLFALAIFAQFLRAPSEARTWQEAGAHEVATIEAAGDLSPLNLVANDLPEIRSWLAAQVCPAPSTLPEAVQKLPILGCAKREWRGQTLSIVCFNLKPGRAVHLVSIDRKNLPASPPENAPQYAEVAGYQTASWSAGSVAMMLLGKVERADLEHLLAPAAVAQSSRVTRSLLAAH